MFLHPSMLFEIDEFDTVFNSLKFAKDGRGESIMEKLLRFYGASNGVYKMRKLSVRTNEGKKTVPGVKWAAAFVEHITEQMLFMVDAYSFENQFDEKCRKAIRYIREAGGRVAYGVLLKRMHESKEVFKQIMETLEENGSVTHDFVSTGGKDARIYRLV